MLRPNSQNARVLRALADGRWHSSAEIQRKSGPAVRINSRISDLRSKGYAVVSGRKPGQGATSYRYRLLEPLDQATVMALITRDEEGALDRKETPRDASHRYRIYRMVYDELELLATATRDNVGVTLIELGEQGRFGSSCVGLLDTHGKEEPGSWIIHPWDTTP
jgi:hypothetical protein